MNKKKNPIYTILAIAVIVGCLGWLGVFTLAPYALLKFLWGILF